MSLAEITVSTGGILRGTDEVATLEALGVRVREETALYLEAEGSALQHAIAIGMALWEAAQLVEDVDWPRWLSENCDLNRRTANRCMRLAFYREQLAPGMTITEAGDALQGQPAVKPQGRAAYATPINVRQEARQLFRAGRSVGWIATHLEISWNTTRLLVDPGYERVVRMRNRERLAAERRARRALREKETLAAAKRSGGAVSRAYSFIRKALPELEHTVSEADTGTRQALDRALYHLRRAEDEVGNALRSGAR